MGVYHFDLFVHDDTTHKPLSQRLITMEVAENHVPDFLSQPGKKATIHKLYSYLVQVEDANTNQNIIIGAPKMPNWLTLTSKGPRKAVLSGTPDISDVGKHSIEFSVTDNIISHPVSQKFILEVEKTVISVIKHQDTRSGGLLISPNPATNKSKTIIFPTTEMEIEVKWFRSMSSMHWETVCFRQIQYQ